MQHTAQASAAKRGQGGLAVGMANERTRHDRWTAGDAPWTQGSEPLAGGRRAPDLGPVRAGYRAPASLADPLRASVVIQRFESTADWQARGAKQIRPATTPLPRPAASKEERKAIGAELRARRHALGLSVRGGAKLAGVPTSALQNVEKGLGSAGLIERVRAALEATERERVERPTPDSPKPRPRRFSKTRPTPKLPRVYTPRPLPTRPWHGSIRPEARAEAGIEIRERRVAAGLTMAALGALVGRSEAAIGLLERGEKGSAELVARVREALERAKFTAETRTRRPAGVAISAPASGRSKEDRSEGA